MNNDDDLIAALDALPPEKHRGAYGLFTDAEFEAIKRARERGVSWATLHATLNRNASKSALQQAYEYWNKKQKAKVIE